MWNKNNLAVAKIAATSGIKPELACVLFTKGKTVASDGYRLLEVAAPKDEGAAPTEAMKGAKPFLVKAEGVMRKLKPEKDERVWLSHLDQGKAEFVVNGEVETLAPVEGRFPDYEQLWPQGEPVVKIKVNAKLLGELLMVMGKMTGAWEPMEVSIYGPEKPILITGGTRQQSARAMMMPIRQ